MKGSLAGLVLAGAMLLPSAAMADVWEPVPPASLGNASDAYIQPDRFRAYALDESALENRLEARSLRAAATVLTLPAPDGSLQRFAVEESPIMEPGLAARHPEITTYAGRGIDDPAATIRADQSPLGFHASVRSPKGAWYVDPYYHLDDSVYITYYGRDVTEDPHGRFVEQEIDEDTDPLSLQAAPQGPEVQLRTYRLALLSDPGYATFFGGPQNVTAAKVTLMNRVNQVYEDETAIRLVLIADNDLLNLDTQEEFSQPNGPCGANPCFATATGVVSCTGGTLTRTRTVIGQLVGASNFDIGHIGLGAGGGGVASLGVVGGGFKAQGCTGLTTPVGDLFAVDYVAHEMGHQFAGPHTFNGTVGNCSGGNRSAASSVEPGSGSSIMAYAGICGRDNLQPHSDPYWSQRSFQQITAFVTSDLPPASEAQTVSLREFDADGEAFRLRLGGAASREITRGSNYTLQGITDAISGNEVQTVAPGAGPFTLGYLGAESAVITPGQNDTQLGIQNAIAGGNEQQVVSLTGFDGTQQSFQVQIGGATSAVLGAGGAAISNNNVAAAINAIPGFAGTVTSSGAGNGGFTLTFAGASAAVDVPPVEIVNCTGTCVASVRADCQRRPAAGHLAGRRHRGGRAGEPHRLHPEPRRRAPGHRRRRVHRLQRDRHRDAQGRAGDAAGRRHGHRQRLGRRHRAQRRRLPAHLRRLARRRQPQPGRSARSERLRRRDRARRPGGQQGQHRHRDRQPRAGGRDRAGLHDPGPHPVRADRQRDRLRRRHAHLHVGAERPRRQHPEPAASAARR